MRKKIVCLALCALLLALSFPAAPQQPKKVPRIGYLSATSPSVNPTRIEAFRQGLRELGYVEGKNIIIEWRYAEGKLDHVSELAATLVSLKVEVIVSAGPAATRPAKRATANTPLIRAYADVPLGCAFAGELARS